MILKQGFQQQQQQSNAAAQSSSTAQRNNPNSHTGNIYYCPTPYPITTTMTSDQSPSSHLVLPGLLIGRLRLRYSDAYDYDNRTLMITISATVLSAALCGTTDSPITK